MLKKLALGPAYAISNLKFYESIHLNFLNF